MKSVYVKRFVAVVLSLMLVAGMIPLDSMVTYAASQTVKSISLNSKQKKMTVGEKTTLKVKSIKPGNSSKKVIWKSQNSKIATVNSSGKVTAKKPGNTTITAISKGNKNVKATCKIKVYAKVKTVTASVSKKTVEVGENFRLKAKIAPSNALKTVSFRSSNERIVSVSSSGVVTGEAIGKATIFITSNSGAKQGKCVVTVSDPYSATGGNITGSQNGKGDSGAKTPTPTPTMNFIFEDEGEEEDDYAFDEDGDEDEEDFEIQRVTHTPTPTRKPTPTNTPVPTEPQEVIVHSGEYKNVSWKIDDEGLLQVVGTGDMYEIGDVPWFEWCEEIKTAKVSVVGATTAQEMFHNCKNMTSVDLTEFDMSSLTNMKGMFKGCTSLEVIDWQDVDTSKVTTMENMFAGCASLMSVPVEEFCTENVKNVRKMFSNCSALLELDLSSFDMSQVIKAENMFKGCGKLISIISPGRAGQMVIELPDGTWQDAEENIYFAMPEDMAGSRELVKISEEKLECSPTPTQGADSEEDFEEEDSEEENFEEKDSQEEDSEEEDSQEEDSEEENSEEEDSEEEDSEEEDSQEEDSEEKDSEKEDSEEENSQNDYQEEVIFIIKVTPTPIPES